MTTLLNSRMDSLGLDIDDSLRTRDVDYLDDDDNDKFVDDHVQSER